MNTRSVWHFDAIKTAGGVHPITAADRREIARFARAFAAGGGSTLALGVNFKVGNHELPKKHCYANPHSPVRNVRFRNTCIC
jgi:hypothetical protein